MRLRLLIPALALAALAAPAAGDPAGFAFLEVPAGARASALAGAYASLAQGADAAFWNPAGLRATRGLEVTASHYEFFESLRHEQFAVAGRMLGGGIGASLRAVYSEPIEERDDRGNLVGTFGAHDLEFAFAYGRSVGAGLGIGGSAQVIRERIANAAATTYAFGGGATWEPPAFAGTRLSLSVHNLGPSATYTIDGVKGEPVALPAALQSGVSWGRALGGGWNFGGALEGRFTRGRSGVGMVGGEIAAANGAALRFGWRANDDATGFSAGAGWAYSSLRLDYAFVPYRLDLGDTHRISFSARF